MSMRKRSMGSDLVRRLRDFNKVIESGGEITEQFTCRRIILDLQPQPYDPAKVKKVRDMLNVSQSLFAQFLGVSVGTLRSWEQGQNRVPRMACRFMDEMERNPGYWLKRLKESVIDKQFAAGD